MNYRKVFASMIEMEWKWMDKPWHGMKNVSVPSWFRMNVGIEMSVVFILHDPSHTLHENWKWICIIWQHVISDSTNIIYKGVALLWRKGHTGHDIDLKTMDHWWNQLTYRFVLLMISVFVFRKMLKNVESMKVNQQNEKYMLHWCSLGGCSIKVLCFMLQYGCQPHNRSTIGWAPRATVVIWCIPMATIRKLRQLGQNGCGPAFSACRC